MAFDVTRAFGAAWQLHTPTWTGPTSFGTGATNEFYYTRIGKTVLFRQRLIWGTSPNAGSGTYYFSLPFTASSTSGWDSPIGQCWLYDQSAVNNYGWQAHYAVDSTNRNRLWIRGASGWPGTLNQVNSIVPTAWAVNDIIWGFGFYETE